MNEQETPGLGTDPETSPANGKSDEQPLASEGAEEEIEPSISGAGCLGVIVSSIVVSALLYVFALSRNEETSGPAYMAVSLLFGFFVVGIIWGVIQQQRESDAARDAEMEALNRDTSQDD
jgi:hypothetical protein